MTTCKYPGWTNGQEEALKNILGGDEVCRKILSGKVRIVVEEIEPPKPQPLFGPFSTITIPATTTKFVAKAKFVVNTSRKAKVKISGTGRNFDDWFLFGEGKIEEAIAERKLRYAKLLKAALDLPKETGEQAIIPELGGEAKVESALAEMFFLMEKQGNGQAGVLLTNGYANIFYIRDQNGVPRAVNVNWYDDGWHVNANAVEYPLEWRDGRRVFSRKALEPSVTASA